MVNDWQTRTLDDLATVERGRFSARPRNNPRYYGGSTPFIQTGDVSSANGLLQAWSQTLNAEGVAVSKVFPSGTIFVTIAANIGDAAISTFDAACPDSVVAVRPRSGVDRDWLYQALRFKKALLESYATQNAQKNINLEILKPLSFDTPPAAEQRRIAEILCTWDDTIEKSGRLIAANELRFGALSIALLRGHRRLPADNSNWPTVSFNEVTCELIDRSFGRLGTDAVMGVNKIHGMIPMKEHVRAENLSRYKIVPPHAFAYNPMRLNIGSIAMNTHGRDVLVSPDYVAFAARNDRLDYRYFDHLRRSPIWSDFVTSAGSGSVRIRIYYEHLSRMRFHLPDVGVQSRIADVIDAAKREIDILKRQVKLLDRQKRGLMQKLLTGEWRVPPRNREVGRLAEGAAEEIAS